MNVIIAIFLIICVLLVIKFFLKRKKNIINYKDKLELD